MGYFYTMGIHFYEEQAAQNCKEQIEYLKIRLSDSTQVEKYVHILKDTLPSGRNCYIVDIYLKGLQYMVGDKKLASKPFFYEIRSVLYNYLTSLDLAYNYAFFEFEGAERFLDEDILATLNKYGIDEVRAEGDPNAATLADNPAEYYYPKRYLDGLVISADIYNLLTIDKSAFEVFKEEYYWLPIPL